MYKCGKKRKCSHTHAHKQTVSTEVRCKIIQIIISAGGFAGVNVTEERLGATVSKQALLVHFSCYFIYISLFEMVGIASSEASGSSAAG